jgi:hypothetical protein
MRNPMTPQERAAQAMSEIWGPGFVGSQGPQIAVIAKAIHDAAVEEHAIGMADAYENAAVLAIAFQGSAHDFGAILREHASAIRERRPAQT